MAIVFILVLFAFCRNHILIFLYSLHRFFSFSRDKIKENTGRGHYLLVKQKLRATDRNSQASCAFAALFRPSLLVHFKAFRAFTRKSQEDLPTQLLQNLLQEEMSFGFFTFGTLHLLHWLH